MYYLSKPAPGHCRTPRLFLPESEPRPVFGRLWLEERTHRGTLGDLALAWGMATKAGDVGEYGSGLRLSRRAASWGRECPPGEPSFRPLAIYQSCSCRASVLYKRVARCSSPCSPPPELPPPMLFGGRQRARAPAGREQERPSCGMAAGIAGGVVRLGRWLA
jgi:hypothetical protein